MITLSTSFWFSASFMSYSKIISYKISWLLQTYMDVILVHWSTARHTLHLLWLLCHWLWLLYHPKHNSYCRTSQTNPIVNVRDYLDTPTYKDSIYQDSEHRDFPMYVTARHCTSPARHGTAPARHSTAPICIARYDARYCTVLHGIARHEHVTDMYLCPIMAIHSGFRPPPEWNFNKFFGTCACKC